MSNGGGYPDIGGRKQSPLAEDAVRAAGREHQGEFGKGFVDVIFTATASSAPGTVGAAVIYDTAAFTAATFSSAKPWVGVTSSAANDDLMVGVLAETTSAGGAGVYAVQTKGPVTLALSSGTTGAINVRLIPGDTSGGFFSTASAPVGNSTATDVLKWRSPGVFAAQSYATNASTVAAYIVDAGRYAHDLR